MRNRIFAGLDSIARIEVSLAAGTVEQIELYSTFHVLDFQLLVELSVRRPIVLDAEHIHQISRVRNGRSVNKFILLPRHVDVHGRSRDFTCQMPYLVEVIRRGNSIPYVIYACVGLLQIRLLGRYPSACLCVCKIHLDFFSVRIFPTFESYTRVKLVKNHIQRCALEYLRRYILHCKVDFCL